MAKSDNNPWPKGFDGHREAQILRVARETTPQQRLEWVEEMLEVIAKTGVNYQERKRLRDRLDKEPISSS